MAYDLHCHSVFSDGSTHIKDLLYAAERANLKGIAITDHDTFEGYKVAKALKPNLELIQGIEISTIDKSRNKKAHILCYSPKKLELLFDDINKITENRRNAMLESIAILNKKYPITLDMVLEKAKHSTCIFKQHIMQCFLELGITTELFGDFFKELFNSKNGYAYIDIDYPDTFDIISKVKKTGGKIVLAHPSEYGSMPLLEELCEKKLIDGIEMNHPRNREEDKKIISELSKEYNLFLTGGTDFHGYFTSKPNPIGSFTSSDETVKEFILKEI